MTKKIKKSGALEKLQSVVSELESVTSRRKEDDVKTDDQQWLQEDAPETKPASPGAIASVSTPLEIDTNNKLYWALTDLCNWKDNPKRITHDNYLRVKKQIEELGEYKPLIINSGKYYGRRGETLGGNTRYRIYRDDLHKQKVWVSVVNPRDFKEALSYALSDNDHAGDYVEEELSELVSHANFSDEELRLFKVDMKEGIDLEKLLDTSGVDPKDLQYKSEFQVVIDCENEIEQQEAYEKIAGLGYKCKVLTL